VLGLEDGTDSLSRNVRNYQSTLRKILEGRRSHASTLTNIMYFFLPTRLPWASAENITATLCARVCVCVCTYVCIIAVSPLVLCVGVYNLVL
jgi:hypothetical protein